MPVTYKKIASVTVTAGAGQAEIEFASIPANYTDLILHLSGRCTGDDFTTYLRFNSSTTNYSQRRLQGTGSAAESATDTAITMNITRSSYTASTFGSATAYIPNYAGSTNKSVSIDSVTENNATVNRNILNAGLWSDTSAITNIKLVPLTGNHAQYSTATLYGISKS